MSKRSYFKNTGQNVQDIYTDKDLELSWIDSKSMNKEINSVKNNVIAENFEKIFSDFWLFFDITSDIKKSLESSLEPLFWKKENFDEKDFSDLVSILNWKKFSEKFSQLEEVKWEKEKDLFLLEIFWELKKNKKFNSALWNFFEDDKAFLKKAVEAREAVEKLFENKELVTHLLWWLWFKKYWLTEFYKNILTYKYLFVLAILVITVIADIDALLRFVAPGVDISSDWLWKIDAISNGLSSELIHYGHIALWALPWVVDSVSKIIFIWLVVSILKSVKKDSLKNSLKVAWVWWVMVWAITVAAFLQAMSWSMSSMANDVKTKEIAWWLWAISENNKLVDFNFENWEKLKKTNSVNSVEWEIWEVDWKNWEIVKIIDPRLKKDLPEGDSGIVDEVIDFSRVFAESVFITLTLDWKIVDNFNYENELKDVINKLDNWELENTWWLLTINKYFKQIDEIWDSDDIYKDMFKVVLKDAAWWASNWISLFWPSSFEKIKLIFKISWYADKWNSFSDQLEIFISSLYWDSDEWKSYLKFIKQKIKDNPWFNAYKVQWIKWKNINDFDTDFVKNNSEKLKSHKDEIVNFISKIKKDWIENIKMSDFNKIIEKFNYFIENEYLKNIENHVNWKISAVNHVEAEFRKIDIKYENPGVEYDKIELDEINFNFKKLYMLSERLVTSDDVLDELRSAVDHHEKTWEIRGILVAASDALKWSFIMNYSDVTAILLAIFALIKFWRKRVNWELKNFGEIQQVKLEKLNKTEEEVKKIFDDIKKIFENKIENKSKINFDKKLFKKAEKFSEQFKVWNSADWEKLIFSKEVPENWKISSHPDYKFLDWRLYNFKNFNFLNLDLSEYLENDVLFISWFNTKDVKNIGIFKKENWNFSVKTSIDLDSDEAWENVRIVNFEDDNISWKISELNDCVSTNSITWINKAYKEAWVMISKDWVKFVWYEWSDIKNLINL